MVYLQDQPLLFVHAATYTGVAITSTARNIDQEHYVRKERAARKVDNGALALEQFIGVLQSSLFCCPELLLRRTLPMGVR